MSIAVQDASVSTGGHSVITGGENVLHSELSLLSPNVLKAQGSARSQPQRGDQRDTNIVDFAVEAAGERVDGSIDTAGSLAGDIVGTTGKYVAVGGLMMASMAMGRDGEEEAATIWDDPSLDPDQQELGMDGMAFDGQGEQSRTVADQAAQVGQFYAQVMYRLQQEMGRQELGVGGAAEDFMERAFYAGQDVYGGLAGQEIALADTGKLKAPEVPDARTPSERARDDVVLGA